MWHSPIERAKEYRRLMDENGWSGRQLAEELSLNAGGVAQALRMLTLPDQVQDQVDQGLLPPTKAYKLSQLQDPTEQVEVANQIISGQAPTE